MLNISAFVYISITCFLMSNEYCRCLITTPLRTVRKKSERNIQKETSSEKKGKLLGLKFHDSIENAVRFTG